MIYRWTPQLDAAIRRAYQAHRGSGVIARLARSLACHPETLRRRAIKLGVLTNHRAWTEDEDELLREHQGASLHALQRRLSQDSHSERSRPAIAQRLRRMQLSAKMDDPDFYESPDMGVLMGVNERTIRRWIEAGKLVATVRHCEQRSRYYVSRAQARTFLMEHVGVWDHRAADPGWFVPLLSKGTRR